MSALGSAEESSMAKKGSESTKRKLAARPKVPKQLRGHISQNDLERIAESEAIEKMTTQEPDRQRFEEIRSYRQRFGAEEEMNLRQLTPKDTLEKMLCQQMCACHHRAMDFIGREGLGEPEALSQGIRLMRLFVCQVEAFKIYRSKGMQTVRVERV